MKTARRLPSQNFKLRHEVVDFNGQVSGHHVIHMTVAYCPESGHPVEVSFVGRGKVGGGMDALLQDLGIWTSRALQGRDPVTGQEVDA